MRANSGWVTNVYKTVADYDSIGLLVHLSATATAGTSLPVIGNVIARQGVPTIVGNDERTIAQITQLIGTAIHLARPLLSPTLGNSG